METSDAAPRSCLRDIGYYAIWFIVWGSLLTAYLLPAELDGWYEFLGVKAYQASVGAALGGICAIGFTLFQNGLNRARRMWRSWTLAIAIPIALIIVLGSFMVC